MPNVEEGLSIDSIIPDGLEVAAMAATVTVIRDGERQQENGSQGTLEVVVGLRDE